MTTENNSESNLVEQPKAVERHGFREFLKKPMGKWAIAGAGLLTVVGLSVGLSRNSDADPGAKGPIATATTEPTAPEVTPTSEPTPTNTPEKPAQEVLNINYESFDGWESKSLDEKVAICDTFYETHPIKSDVVQSSNNTGEEIISYFDAKLEIIYSVYLNELDNRNQSVAEKLTECATSVHSSDGGARSEIVNDMEYIDNSSIEGTERDRPANVTRYSDGLQYGVDSNGVAWQYKLVEYNIVDKYNVLENTLFQAYFEWGGKAGWQEVLVVPGTLPGKYGDKPPIIVDPSRADAPWQG